MLVNLFHGFCMALADSVPGVSGGTIAFILGFYDRFLNALHELFGRDREARLPALRYLVKLGASWIIGMALAATALAQVFDSGVYALSSAFLGLTAASLPFILKEERETLRGHAPSLPFALLGMALVIGLVALRGANMGGALNLSSLHAWQYLYLFQTGMLAIMAMVMPFRIDGRGDMNAFVLTSPLAGVMLLTRRQPFYPSAAHDKFFSICTAFGGYTKFGIAPEIQIR